METNRLIHLLARKIGKVTSDEEEEELQQLLNNKPEFTFFNALLDAVESDKHAHHPVSREDLIADNWKMIASNLDTEQTLPQAEAAYPWENNPKQRRWQVFWRRAAVWIGILLLGGGGFWLLDNQEKIGVTTAQSDGVKWVVHGAPEQQRLPDGSVVWLNSGSVITYGEDFMESKREVYLQGEAYFDIKHNAEHPFIVHAGNVDIKVLGTAFNVQAYKDEDKVETTLINGKIKVQVAGNPDKSFVLKPNEKLTVAMDLAQTAKKLKRLQPPMIKKVQFKVEELNYPDQTAPLKEIAWLKDKLVFQNERFDELTKSLERRYDVNIIFQDPSLKTERLNGIFKNEDIRKALKILQMTTPFQYEIEGDTVYLRR